MMAIVHSIELMLHRQSMTVSVVRRKDLVLQIVLEYCLAWAQDTANWIDNLIQMHGEWFD